MKIYIKIDDTGGYPEGIIPHMVKAIIAFNFHLNYFYDAHIFVNLAYRSKFRRLPDKKEGKK